ncbi:MAG TPA: hypothetical protein VGU74_09505 [Gemmatimonadales bacterium]|nr:hypothetical protein [Gemmatimonadales bacterium]
MLGAPGDDALRERWTDTRQACDVAHVGTIEIDALPGQQRTGELRGAASDLLEGVRARRGAGLQLDVTGRSSGRWREEVANTGTSQRQARQQQCGTPIVHPPT